MIFKNRFIKMNSCKVASSWMLKACVPFFILLAMDSPLFAQAGAATPVVESNTVMWLGVFAVVAMIVLGGQFIALVGKTFRIYELSSEVNGKHKDINWNAINGMIFLIALVAAFAGIAWEIDVHGKQLLPPAASIHGAITDNLFTITCYIIGFVFVITHILLFGWSYFYSHNANRKAYFYPENNKLEQAWTIAPAIVLTVLVIFGFFTWRHIFNGDELKGRKDVITVELTGEQWKWWARYPGADGVLGRKDYKLIQGGNVLGVDFKDKNSYDDVIDKQGDTITLPVNRPVKLILGAKDVIHSAYMPYFRVQMNCVPGVPTYFYFTPTVTTDEMRARLGVDTFNYIMLCAKICGAGHYNMGRVIRVVTEQEYKKWLKHLKPWYSIPANREQIKLTEDKKRLDINKGLALTAN